tara:strand:- start:805 stop:2580 length:1776 start_codon:yes stop_codon:yes gene_type:complete
MTVLPNAPIDVSTGLPIPTIAVAAGGGLGIIKHDGDVISKAVTDGDTDVANIDFTDDGNLLVTRNNYNYVVVTKLGDDESVAYPSQYVSNINYFRDGGTHNPPPYSPGGSSEISGYNLANIPKSMRGTDFALADIYGLSLFSVDRELPASLSTNLVTYITKDFNTGWMVGNIKAAFMSDTDTTNLSGTNLVTNGGFADTSSWSIGGTNWSSFSIVGGRLRMTNQNNQNGFAYQDITVVVGRRYILTCDCYKGTNSYTGLSVSSQGGGNMSVTSGQISTDGTYTLQFVADHTTVRLFLGQGSTGNGEYTEADNVSLVMADLDRSNNTKGLQSFGTVTKTAVATGAELVSYSGWSSSNYLRQPYNSNLDFGTGDWSFNFWINPNDSSTGSVIMSRWSYNVDSSTAGRIGIYFNSGNLRFDLTDDGASSYQAITGSNGLQDKTGWHMVNIIRRGGYAEMWVDGKVDARTLLTGTADNSYSNTSAVLEIGHSPNMGSADSGIELALIRISASAPSVEQIKKMYNDEKKLFATNAKCTLYGSSNAVTALGFDDSNDTLHIGTSSGRSDFVGLNRINNTTTAVATAISASNGLVVEQ